MFFFSRWLWRNLQCFYAVTTRCGGEGGSSSGTISSGITINDISILRRTALPRWVYLYKCCWNRLYGLFFVRPSYVLGCWGLRSCILYNSLVILVSFRFVSWFIGWIGFFRFFACRVLQVPGGMCLFVAPFRNHFCFILRMRRRAWWQVDIWMFLVRAVFVKFGSLSIPLASLNFPLAL